MYKPVKLNNGLTLKANERQNMAVRFFPAF